MANEAPAPLPEGQEEPESRDAKPWIDLIENAEKVFTLWQEKSDSIGKDYASLSKLASTRTDREFQMFYANLEVLKPSIYARAPQPVVVQRFKDSGKAVARKTGEILERALVTSFDTEKVHETLKRVRDDLALTGRGTMWLRYESYQKGDGLKECTKYEWVHRKDFLHEPARIWSESGWVARGTWLTKKAGEKRFGEAWKEIAYVDADDTAEEYRVEQKARVWELWHREKDTVVWIHPHASQVLDLAPPHLSIEGFFPCPRPAFGTCEPDSLVPVPDACFYRDQLEEINELTSRISALSESLRLVGFYPSGAEDIGAAIELAIQQLNTGENRRTMIPLPGMSQMGGPASLRDAIVWLPIEEVANTVKELVALRRQLIEDVYQISGISDIMRGQTEASETLGAQQLKSQYGSIRIKDRQSEMVKIADGALNIAGEIMAENFSPETLLEMSQVDLPKQADVLAQHQQAVQQQIQQMAAEAAKSGQPMDPEAAKPIIAKAQKEAEEVVTVEKVFGLLRSQKTRPWTLMIATDSTIQPDENAEKAARNEFGQAFSVTTTALAPLIAQAPEAAEFAGEMLKFMLAPFRAGRQMEQAIDDFVEAMTEKAKQPPPPNPDQIKAEGEAKKLEAEVAGKAAELEDKKLERAAKAQQSQMDGAAKAQEAAAKAQEAQAERQHKQAMAAVDRDLKQMELRAKEIDLELKKIEGVTRRLEADAKHRDIEVREAELLRPPEQVQPDPLDVESRHLDVAAKRLGVLKGEAEYEETDKRKQEQKKALDEMNEQQMGQILGAFNQLAGFMQKLAEQQQTLAEQHGIHSQNVVKAVMAPRVPIRDPKTNRIIGARAQMDAE